MSGRRQRLRLAEPIYQKKKLARARRLSWESPQSSSSAQLSIMGGRNTKQPPASRYDFPQQRNQHRLLPSRQRRAVFRRRQWHPPRTPHPCRVHSPAQDRQRARTTTILRIPRHPLPPNPQLRLHPPQARRPHRTRLARTKLVPTNLAQTKLAPTRPDPTRPDPTRLAPTRLDHLRRDPPNRPERPWWSREARPQLYKPHLQRPTLPLPAWLGLQWQGPARLRQTWAALEACPSPCCRP